MKATAIVFEADRKVGFHEIEMPEPADTDLVVRATCTGISVGTERWALISQRQEISFPNIPGYLGVGVVENAGPAREGFSEGDRVFYFSTRLPEPYASNSWMGTHVSHALVPDQEPKDWPPYVCRIPEGISDAEAAMAGLASVAARGADMVKVLTSDIAVVLGLGLIGQSSAQVLRAKGARVVVADMLELRVNQALEMGCEEGVVLDGGPILPQLKHLIPEGGADIVVDTTSVAPVVNQVGDLLKMDGQFIMQGYYPGETPVCFDGLHAKRALIRIPCAQSKEAHEYCHRLMLGGMLKLDGFVTHTFSPQEAPAAYAMVVERPQDFTGIVFDWSQS